LTKLITISLLKTKTINKLEIEENNLNIIKDICEKPSANITINGERLEAFYSLIWNKVG
jgi:hypothetical protein